MRPFVRRVCLCLLACVAGLTAGCDDNTQPLLSVPTVRQANEIVVALDAAGVRATIEETSVQRKPAFAIRVSAASEAAARRVLVEKNLPREPLPGFEELVGQSSLILSAADQQQRTMIAVAGELSRTLEAIDGVTQARVHLAATPTGNRLNAPTPGSPPSATVFLRTDRPVDVLALSAVTTQPSDAASPADRIRQLVAAAVPGLTAEHVSVMSSVVPLTRTPLSANTSDNAELQAAVAKGRQLRTIVIALAVVSVGSVILVLIQAAKMRRT